MFILFFIYTILLGLYLLSFFPKILPLLAKLVLIYLLGTLFLTVIFFLTYPLLAVSDSFLYLPFFLLFVLFLYKRKTIIRNVIYLRFGVTDVTDLLMLLFSLAFSSFLFLKTIWYDFALEQTLIGGKLWSDFGAHIPLMRSFFPGFNFPPEYPLFAHSPIRYYFLFQFHMSLLEKMGLPLFLAIDIPSILSFTCVLLTIYCLGKYVLQKKLAGILGVVFFLFNGSFSWWYFLKNNFSFNIFSLLKKLVSLKEFPAFNPYDKTLVSGGFWNLNVYTNQRHLAFSLCILFIFIFLLLWKRLNQERFSWPLYLIFGVSLGFLPLFHGVIFLLTVMCLPLIFLIDRDKKKFFVLGFLFGVFSFIELLYLKGTAVGVNSGIRFLPGYLTAYNLSLFNFIRYWILNLGLIVILAPLGFFLTPKKFRLLFLFAIPPFMVGNLFSFSPDIATNHKFFNFSIIIFNLYAAYFIADILTRKSDYGLPSTSLRPDLHALRSGLFLFGIILIFFLTISGFIDIFPIINDNYYGVPDPSHKPDIAWIEKNTGQKSVFANSYYLYHPASLAGRRILLGWPYFSWSAGYDTENRVKDLSNLYLASDKNTACDLIDKLRVDYVSLNLNIRDVNIKFDENFWQKNFPLVYDNSLKSGLLIYDVRNACFL